LGLHLGRALVNGETRRQNGDKEQTPMGYDLRLDLGGAS